MRFVRSLITLLSVAAMLIGIALGPIARADAVRSARAPTVKAGDRAPASPGRTRSDFNGDGFADLAIGVQGQTVDGLANAGGVSVIYGSAAGLASPGNQFWTENTPGVPDQAEADDLFGFSLASGDFNGDGFDDLAIGCPHKVVGGMMMAGAVTVLFGSPSGLTATGSQFWTQDSPHIKDQADDEDHFGSAVAAADFNQDGYADLAIGAPHETLGTITMAGAVSVIYGSASGLSALGNQFWNQDSPGILDQSENHDHFGVPLVSGDFNGDGFPDLAIGAFHETVGTKDGAGAVSVIYGSASGLYARGNQFWNQDSPGVEGVADPNEAFGWALGAGDFNGDGYADLAIGVPNEYTMVPLGAGAVNVLYGSSSGLQTAAPQEQLWTQDSPNVLDSAEAGDWFGGTVAAGDFNGDGYVDLAVGVFYEDVGTIVDGGAVNVLYGSPGGLQATAPANQFWTESDLSSSDGTETGDLFGRSLAMGDLNGDGVADLAVGIAMEDVGTIIHAGAAGVLYGSSTGLQTTAPADQFWTQDSPGIVDSAEASDTMGQSMAAATSSGSKPVHM